MTKETNSKSRVTKWRGYAVSVLVFVIIVVSMRVWQQRDIPSGTAPALQGVTLAGQPYTLPTHPEKPVLVHFWATWCPVCRAEQDSIAAIAQDYPNTITIAMQSGGSAEITRYMQEQKINFPVVNDTDGTLSSTWGIRGVPTSFVVAPDGQIRFVEVGYTTGIGLRLRLWLAGL
ncbi:MAG: redoxin domain-containing protein [Gallionellaceae bacterium]|nr:redoxin domain-containing protein [Gallionellaceae bacterium]